MHRSIIRSGRMLIALLLTVVIALSTTPNVLAHHSTSGYPQIISPHARVYGKTYGEWSARWWQWAFRLPVRNGHGTFTHPLFVNSGKVDCSYGQAGKVWFLGGTFTTITGPNDTVVGIANRSCRIPEGTTLFFPILNAEMDTIDMITGKPTNMPVRELRKVAREQMDKATNLAARIDGWPVRDLARYRVRSPVFAITLPKDNLYQYNEIPVAAGTYYPVVADGYFLMLAPLPVGKHTISFQGASPGFQLNVSYTITVTRNKH
jgi:hypothetical protein